MDIKLRQLFDPDTGTWSYLIWDPVSLQGLLIDPVKEQVVRDLGVILELGLTLKYTLETHIHADHITGAGELRTALGSSVAVHANSGAACADVLLEDGDVLPLGDAEIQVLYTPGHTNTDISCRIPGAVFTGDTLLIEGCGRTDFQSGDAAMLYDSITGKLFALPDDTVVYPGHDYNGRARSTIGHEKVWNPRLGGNKSKAEFVAIMDGLVLDPPRRIDVAVPGNQRCGL
jgi:glyoxylase-like metal-dependent hydrolase (beta-lactamase superfamily II)